MALSQDLPPKGGYAPIQWKRNLPSRGFNPRVYFAIITGICGYGFYKLIRVMRERNELAREKQWSRFYILPLLEAEADRDLYRRTQSLIQKEQEIMSEVPGFDATESVYNDGRFRKPSVSWLRF